jgi:hypothetical protein
MTTEEPIQALPEEHTDIDYLLVADFAEVINGKTYLMGGGWNSFTAQQFPTPFKLAIAVGVLVPYLDANIPHHLTVVLRNEATEYFRMEGDLETGRPPGARGEPILVPIAVNAQFIVPEAQTLELTAQVDGRSIRRTTIRADAQPGAPAVDRR